ncbi:lactate/malate family dehydrogenase [Cerasicoccus maritimus]|uniref:lactate/malate family dehydrogenase n=1 Tax=Cerasicoccus maritimus TaxID=490089 RepID=UPI002852CB04|nr:hypothetical protein [Cerasicoccus maritimus]
MKAAIIGGAGLLGSAVVAAFLERDLFIELTLLDAQGQLAEAEAQDFRESFLEKGTVIHSAAQIDFASQSDLIVFAGGFASQSKEPRIDLARRYLRHFCWQLSQLKEAGVKQDAVILIAAEPAELLTAMAVSYLGLPPERVIGMGTVVDARRLRVGLSQALSVGLSQVSINAIGVRGEGMVPLWSGAKVAGESISTLKPWEHNWQHEVEQRARNADTAMMMGKGGAYRANAAAVAEVATAIVRDTQQILPVSVCHDFRTPRYGLRKTCLALPTEVGRRGAGEVVDVKLWPKEEAALRQTARRVQRDLRTLVSEA